jgi:ribose transport system substrate-binding protein
MPQRSAWGAVEVSKVRVEMSRSWCARCAGIVAAAAIGLAALGCGSEEPAGSGSAQGATSYRLAGTSGIAADPFWISSVCGGEAAAKAAGSTMTWKSMTTLTTANDQAALDAIKLLKPDGVVVLGYRVDAYGPMIGDYMRRGVPVVMSVSGTPSQNYYKAVLISRVGDPHVVELGNLIARNFGSERGSIAILRGSPSDVATGVLSKPVIEELKKHPNIDVLPTQFDNFDRSTAASIVSGLIAAHPDLKAVYAVSGPEGLGALTALRQSGKLGDIRLYTGGGDPDLVAALRAGEISALLANSPYKMGYDSVNQLIEYLKAHPEGGPVEPAKPQDVYEPLMVLTKSNIDSPEAQDFIYKTEC